MPTESALKAGEILRDGSLFQWYVIPLFVFVDLLLIVVCGIILKWI